MRACVAAVVGVLLLSMTAARVRVWGDETRLWQSAADHAPLKPRPLMNYGRQLALSGDPIGAADAYIAARLLAEARPRAEARVIQMAAGVNLTLVLVQMGNLTQARQEIAETHRQFPTMLDVQRVAQWIDGIPSR